MYATYPFSTYSVYYYSGSMLSARIHLDLGTRGTAMLRFLPDGDVLPANESREGTITLSFYLSNFKDIVDLLREEKPLWLHVYAMVHVMGWIATSPEPVGEEEGK